MESWELVENPGNRVKSDASDSEYDIGSTFSSDGGVFDEDIDEPVCSEPFTPFFQKNEKWENIQNKNSKVVEYKKIPFLENLSANHIPISFEKKRIDAMSLCILALLNQMELKSSEENSQKLANAKENREDSNTHGTIEEISNPSESSNIFENSCDQKMHYESFTNARQKSQNDVEVNCQCISPRVLENVLQNTGAAVSEKIGSFLDKEGNFLDTADEICRAFIDKVCTYEFESTMQLNPSETIGTFKNSANTVLNKMDEILETADDALTTFLG